MSVDKVKEIRDDDRLGRLEFNRTWWGDVQEGEPIAEDEITEVRWLISEVSSLLSELDAAQSERDQWKSDFEELNRDGQEIQDYYKKVARSLWPGNDVPDIDRIAKEFKNLQQQLDAAKQENERLLGHNELFRTARILDKMIERSERYIRDAVSRDRRL